MHAFAGRRGQRLILYTKPGCPLCDRREVRGGGPVTLKGDGHCCGSWLMLWGAGADKMDRSRLSDRVSLCGILSEGLATLFVADQVGVA